MPKAKNQPDLKINKSRLWLYNFLNSANKTTFLHRTNSALAAGYKPGNSAWAMGEQNYKKCENEISKWLDENGLSENALKQKLLSLLEAKQTQFFQKDGIVTDQREVDAIEVQRKTLDMAIRIKGLYAPEKQEHSGNLEIIVTSNTGRTPIGSTD